LKGLFLIIFLTISENFETDQLRKEYGKIMKEVGQKKKDSKGEDPCTVNDFLSRSLTQRN
jgi:hypothetical protein